MNRKNNELMVFANAGKKKKKICKNKIKNALVNFASVRE